MTNDPVQPGGGYSRIDIVKSVEVFKHAITKADIITRLAPEEAILLGFQPWGLEPRRAFTFLPCHIPIVPGRGGVYRDGVS